jgi:agmatinase
MTTALQTALADLDPGSVAILGLPWDESSSFVGGAAEAPTHIRQALHSPASNLACEAGVDLATESRFRDLGDLELDTAPEAFDLITETVDLVLSRQARLLGLGGDHSVTYPIVRAYGRHFPRLNLLHCDAHPDLYDEFEGNRLSHACPFARIMEEGLVQRLVQVGIRTMNPHQQAQAERFGVEVVSMHDWTPDHDIEFDGPVYLSFDLDALDPAFAPGVAHREAGGLSTRESLRLIAQLRAPLVGSDIVELNPSRDSQDLTAVVAAKLVKELAARMLDL